MNHQRQQIIDYLREENRILHAHSNAFPFRAGAGRVFGRYAVDFQHPVVSEKSIVLSWVVRKSQRLRTQAQ